MKHAMPKRASLGKISTFLRSVKGRKKGNDARRLRRTPYPMPNSSKVGAGNDNTTVIRNFIVSKKTQKRRFKEKIKAA